MELLAVIRAPGHRLILPLLHYSPACYLIIKICCGPTFTFTFYRTISDMEGGVMLPVPHIMELDQGDRSIQALAKDPYFMKQLEEAVMSWEEHMTKVTDSYLTKVLTL
jgi:hypothetical protein